MRATLAGGIALLCFAAAVPLHGQAAVTDLRAELNSGRIELVEASGNGSSSGAAVEGFLVNRTSAVRSVDVFLSSPLHFRNRGAGQDMVAVQVLGADGRYVSDGQRSFLQLRPGVRTPVVFISFCLDFDKDNPTSSERFDLQPNGTGLERVLRRIADHARRHPDADITATAQAGIWLAQGITIQQIRERLDVSAAQERIARTFAQLD